MLPILTGGVAVLCHSGPFQLRDVVIGVPHTTATTSLWLENCAYVGDCRESLAVLWFHHTSLAMFPIPILSFFCRIGFLDFMVLIGLAWMGNGLVVADFHSICCEAELGDFFSVVQCCGSFRVTGF
jgi:hypothetical protein